MAIAIEAIDHVVLRVRDLERALWFYRNVLGCQEERRVDELGLVQLRAGSSLIDLVDIEGPLGREGGAPPGREGRNMAHFAVRLEAFDAGELGAHLRRHGVAAGEVATRYGAQGEGPSMYIQDPDGNTVELKGPASTR